MNKIILLFALFLLCIQPFAQKRFRDGIFLHHSTGGNIWGPNGSSVSVPDEIDKYNAAKGLKGDDKVSFRERWFAPGDNEWYIVRDFFEGNLNNEDFDFYCDNFEIIMIKSCFPSSDIKGEGRAGENPTNKTIYNYKEHWRAIVRIMAQHPDNFFVIWTNAPQESGSTTASEAGLSKEFCNWAKNILAEGKDEVYGAFPPNVYVFDFFSKLTDANGYMKTDYRTRSGDSHPNSAATELVAPQLVKEVFDAALRYERSITPLSNLNADDLLIFPNPATNKINIKLTNAAVNTEVLLSNLCGQVLSSFRMDSDNSVIDISSLPKGVYFVNLQDGKKKVTKKIIKN